MDAIDAVGILADQHARVLLLDEQGLDHGAIAQRLGIEVNVVPALLAVARRKLAELEQAAPRDAGSDAGPDGAG